MTGTETALLATLVMTIPTMTYCICRAMYWKGEAERAATAYWALREHLDQGHKEVRDLVASSEGGSITLHLKPEVTS